MTRTAAIIGGGVIGGGWAARGLAWVLAVIFLESCTQDGSMTERERASCLKSGGTPEWAGMLVGEPVENCRMPPPDEGKSCSKQSDCSDVCSAEARTCTWRRGGEMTVLNENGEPETGMSE